MICLSVSTERYCKQQLVFVQPNLAKQKRLFEFCHGLADGGNCGAEEVESPKKDSSKAVQANACKGSICVCLLNCCHQDTRMVQKLKSLYTAAGSLY